MIEALVRLLPRPRRRRKPQPSTLSCRQAHLPLPCACCRMRAAPSPMSLSWQGRTICTECTVRSSKPGACTLSATDPPRQSIERADQISAEVGAQKTNENIRMLHTIAHVRGASSLALTVPQVRSEPCRVVLAGLLHRVTAPAAEPLTRAPSFLRVRQHGLDPSHQNIKDGRASVNECARPQGRVLGTLDGGRSPGPI